MCASRKQGSNIADLLIIVSRDNLHPINYHFLEYKIWMLNVHFIKLKYYVFLIVCDDAPKVWFILPFLSCTTY